MITFDKDMQNPFAKPEKKLLEPGTYVAVAEKTEMRAPKNGGADYLNIQWKIYNEDDKPIATVFDMITTTDKPVPKWKLHCLMEATGLTSLTQLKDICKCLPGRKCLITLQIDKNEQYGDRNTVNPFGMPYEAIPVKMVEEPINEEDLPFTVGEPQPYADSEY